MRTGLNLTIQDYFKQSGIRESRSGCRRGNRRAAEEGDTLFSEALAAAQSPAATQSVGLTIRDYMTRPVVVQNAPSLLTSAPELPPLQGARDAEMAPAIAEAQKPAQTHQTLAPPKRTMPSEKAPVTEKDQILASIDKAARRYNLSKALIKAVVRAESDYQVRAVSSAGARGLMQLMPATADELGVRDPFDIDQNIDGGAKYLRNMLDMFNGDVKLALSAYNAGPGNVLKYNGQVPFSETRDYVNRVMRFSRNVS